MAVNPWMLIPIGCVTGVIYYAVFRFVILKFDLKTPGRAEYEDTVEISSTKGNDSDFVKIAAIILEGLGGKGNIKELASVWY